MNKVQLRSSAQKVSLITVAFMLLGPPIGAVIWLIYVVVIELLFAEKIPGVVQIIETILFVTPVAMLVSYLFGLLPAALAGILVGIARIKFGHVSWIVALLIVGTVGACDVVISSAPMGLPQAIPFIIVTCAIATFVCWRVIQNGLLERHLFG